MKNEIKLIGLILIAPLIGCDNSEVFPAEVFYELEIKVNLLNYTDNEFLEGTVLYLGAIVKDTFTAVDSIKITSKIPVKTGDNNHSELLIPEDNTDDWILSLWEINLGQVKEISNNGGILIRFPNKESELMCNEFTFYESETNRVLDLSLNSTINNFYYYSIDVEIEKSNLIQRKNSHLIFKQLIN